MAHKRVKTEDMDVNYKFACRCCLKSEAEFFKLDSLIECDTGGNDESSTKIPLIRLLLYCMRVENQPELPQYICVECSKSLQIAYYFIQNGLRAHEILCRKLCPGKLKNSSRPNGQHATPWREPNYTDASLSKNCNQKPQRPAVRHECKVCGANLYNSMELKKHIRKHADSSSHQCKLCSFVTLKHRLLLEHYRRAHGLTAAQIEHQLKIRRSMQAAANAIIPPPEISTGGDEGQVKVCTLEDMELLIPTVLTPEDFSHPQLDADQLRDIEQQLTNSLPDTRSSSTYTTLPTDPTIDNPGSTNLSIGAEFLVMPDGSLQQVNDGGVVFEYIDDSKTTNTATNTTLHSLFADSKTDLTTNSMDIDLSHMVVDTALPQIKVKPKPRPTYAPIRSLKHKCKLCPKAFPTIARLKSHQLTHSHLPKFYCDQCSYYSLRSADLIQHYMTQHKSSIGESRTNHMERTQSMLPSDRSRIYSCDMCLFEAPSSGQLRVHYSDKHLIVPSEVQLRPTWTHEPKDRSFSTISNNGSGSSQPDIPLGIKYPPMTSVATAVVTATTTTTDQLAQPTTTTVVSPSGDINVVVDATSLFYAAGAEQLTNNAETRITPAATDPNSFTMFPESSFVNSITTTTSSTVVGETSGVASVTVTSNTNTSIIGDMQEFIDNTDVAAICTIPADDMPVVDGDDIVIDNNNISLDFEVENLFDDFDDVEVGDDDEEDDVENEDENDNNEAAADQNLLLTSDDDDVDDFDDEQSKHLQKPYCIHCNKKFTSQYKFENHMFVHRGLAPYRCELCTNLYNMKRLLIRHYKTVHKRMPTRDMVQAKGDKVSVARTTIEKINVQLNKNPTLMCAKCPFESDVEGEMRKHLNAHHGINDGSVNANEVFIIRKLPYDCPRCIRSFAAKRTLTRHLQRSHLVDTIIEMQAPQLSTSSATTTTTSTATTTLPQNITDSNQTITTATIATAAAGEGTVQQDTNILLEHEATHVEGDGKHNGDGDNEGEREGGGNCGKRINSVATINSHSNSKYVQHMPEQQLLQPHNDTDTQCTPETLSTNKKVEAKTTTTKTDESNAETTEIIEAADTTSSEGSEIVTNAESAMLTAEKASNSIAGTATVTPITSTVRSTLFPTPFDFDLDFIGDGSNPTSIKNNDTFNIGPLPSHLLNGTDQLLTAALEESPVKELRTRLPRTPIFVCKQCNQTFDELRRLLQHELEHHSSGIKSPRDSYQHQCKICNTTFRTVTLFNYHMKRHASAKISCKECPKMFSNDAELERHIAADHSVSAQTPFVCGVDGCIKTFNYKHHLKRHQTASHTPVQYTCPECGLDMLTSLLLRNHMSSHKSSHSYKCPKCARIYMRRNPFRRHALRDHKWRLTDEEIDQIYCNNNKSKAGNSCDGRSAELESDQTE